MTTAVISSIYQMNVKNVHQFKLQPLIIITITFTLQWRIHTQFILCGWFCLLLLLLLHNLSLTIGQSFSAQEAAIDRKLGCAQRYGPCTSVASVRLVCYQECIYRVGQIRGGGTLFYGLYL